MNTYIITIKNKLNGNEYTKRFIADSRLQAISSAYDFYTDKLNTNLHGIEIIRVKKNTAFII